MIYVLTYPDRIIDKIKYQIFGTMPMYSGDEVRYGGGMAELITSSTNSCRSIPMVCIVEVVFDGGYSEALEKVRKEANENIMGRIGAMSEPSEDQGGMGGDVSYVGVEPLTDSRSYM